MTLREDLLPVFERVARQIPVDLGLRTRTVKRQIVRWDGGHVGAGTEAVLDEIEITPAPKVRTADENTLRVGPITPSYGSGATAGGYTPERLNPRDLQADQELRYEVTGPDGTMLYRLVKIDDTRAFGYTLILECLDRSPPR
jgi:hypothetical protein